MCDPAKCGGVAVKVADFDMAVFAGVDENLRGRCGTPGYVAPEIFTAAVHGGYGNKLDVFSAVVPLYVLLCGYDPFCGSKSDDKLIAANKAADVEFLYSDWSELSVEARDLVEKMLERDAKKRIKEANQRQVRIGTTMDLVQCSLLSLDQAYSFHSLWELSQSICATRIGLFSLEHLQSLLGSRRASLQASSSLLQGTLANKICSLTIATMEPTGRGGVHCKHSITNGTRLTADGGRTLANFGISQCVEASFGYSTTMSLWCLKARPSEF